MAKNSETDVIVGIPPYNELLRHASIGDAFQEFLSRTPSSMPKNKTYNQSWVVSWYDDQPNHEYLHPNNYAAILAWEFGYRLAERSGFRFEQEWHLTVARDYGRDHCDSTAYMWTFAMRDQPKCRIAFKTVREIIESIWAKTTDRLIAWYCRAFGWKSVQPWANCIDHPCVIYHRGVINDNMGVPGVEDISANVDGVRMTGKLAQHALSELETNAWTPWDDQELEKKREKIVEEIYQNLERNAANTQGLVHFGDEDKETRMRHAREWTAWDWMEAREERPDRYTDEDEEQGARDRALFLKYGEEWWEHRYEKPCWKDAHKKETLRQKLEKQTKEWDEA